MTSRFNEAVEAYEEALRLEPSLSSVAESLQEARAAAAAMTESASPRTSAPAPSSTAMPPGMPDLSSLAGLAGLGGGGGGMPDLSALGGLMNNPMVQNMMQNPQFMSMYGPSRC